ncbi:peptidyl-alpha-hydroxyglycine alpha-amidating lyase 2 [Folsomia candida]|uniref:peptidylamidoglycolate lyase n=1 Tax=Folsomia candida TaxID=158441 RepID=A0A226EN09_FOLCA|nr:peptidyl-alpha-hydroxyglycine alpha-amidating lyase 2 [Folsomia candida]OXA58670.1 Peptidyl-alpha-hydroxyglycine alpha-amidating lyase 2 [Folsomia candida]
MTMGFKRILSSLTLNYLVATWTCSLICSGASTQFQKAEENVKALLKGQFDEKTMGDMFHPEEVEGWPLEEYDLGQISGVDVDRSGNPIIFHRGTVIWDAGSFNETNHYQRQEEGPIEEDTMVVLDGKTGQMLASWGGNLFYMPHGITIDHNSSIWVTDVALHQVFKFTPGADKPELTIGKAFQPGTSNEHFCKPTDVAVSKSGVFFVADGYCNSRIMKYSKDGKFLAKYGDEGWIWMEGKGSALAIPHSLALIEDEVLCIADREHRRILCINAGLQNPQQFGQIVSVTNGVDVGRVFGITYAKGRLYAVNGAGSSPAQTQGLTLDWKTSQVVDTWTSGRSFISPHDIAVSPNGEAIFISEIGPNRLTKFVVTPTALSSLYDNSVYEQ